MPLYNIENPIQKAMTGLNNAANTYGRMDKKKPNTQQKDPMAPVKTAVALGETAYQGYSIYDSLKSSLTPESGGQEAPWDGPNYDNGESGGQAMSGGEDNGSGIGEDFFNRDNTANIQEDYAWDSPNDSATAMDTPEPPIDTTPTASNAGANGHGPNLNPSLTNNPSLNQGVNAQTLDLGSGSGGGGSTTQTQSQQPTTPQPTTSSAQPGVTPSGEPATAMTTDPTAGASQMVVPETQAGTELGTQAVSQVGTEVGAQTGTQLGTQAMTQTGTQVGTQLGTQVGTQAMTQVGTQVGTQVATQAGTQLATQTVATTAGSTMGGAAGGAAMGAEGGSVAGPWGTAVGAVVGVVGGFLLS